MKEISGEQLINNINVSIKIYKSTVYLQRNREDLIIHLTMTNPSLFFLRAYQSHHYIFASTSTTKPTFTSSAGAALFMPSFASFTFTSSLTKALDSLSVLLP